eukprot:6781808-Prymnesium_polylepis.1
MECSGLPCKCESKRFGLIFKLLSHSLYTLVDTVYDLYFVSSHSARAAKLGNQHRRRHTDALAAVATHNVNEGPKAERDGTVRASLSLRQVKSFRQPAIQELVRPGKPTYLLNRAQREDFFLYVFTQAFL